MEVTLLEENQVFGDNKLEIFEQYGVDAKVTDYAILLGAIIDFFEKVYLNSRTGSYFLKSDIDDEWAYCVDDDEISCELVGIRYNGIRPIISLLHSSNKNEVEYGYYPQTAVSKNMQEELETLFQMGNLLMTDSLYTTDSTIYDDYWKEFCENKYHEYEYNGKKYVRVIANSSSCLYEFYLSNGEKYKNGDIVWVEVEPIKWLIDEKAGLMITEKIICSGIQFNKEENYKCKFENTFIYKFLNTYFIKDIQQNIQKELKIRVEYEKSKQEIELENIEKTKQKILALKNKIK